MDCDIAESPTTFGPGHPALAPRGSAQDYAPFSNEPRQGPIKDSNREDLQLSPQDADGNQVEDEQRDQGVVALPRPSAILRYIINKRLGKPVPTRKWNHDIFAEISYKEEEFLRHYVGSCMQIRTLRIAVLKTRALALRRENIYRFFY